MPRSLATSAIHSSITESSLCQLRFLLPRHNAALIPIIQISLNHYLSMKIRKIMDENPPEQPRQWKEVGAKNMKDKLLFELQRKLFLVSHGEEGHGGLYKAPMKEERRMRKAKRRERSVLHIDMNLCVIS